MKFNTNIVDKEALGSTIGDFFFNSKGKWQENRSVRGVYFVDDSITTNLGNLFIRIAVNFSIAGNNIVSTGELMVVTCQVWTFV